MVCWVLKKDRYTKIEIFMENCNWLSISQIIVYHSILFLWIIWHEDTERFLRRDLERTYDGKFNFRKNQILLNKNSWQSRSLAW